MTGRARLRWLLVADAGIAIAAASRTDLGTTGTVVLGVATRALAVAVVTFFYRDLTARGR